MQQNKNIINELIKEVQKVILGKEKEIKLSLACFFAGGHLLIEDIPGVGKTSLAKALSIVLGLNYNRVQFTSDLLPSDILGVNIFDVASSSFKFKRGAIFTQFLLADEINRATPKTQSALLEAMEEKQVTVDGVSHPLPKIFFVIATQNPKEDIGVFELPHSQLDRFFITIEIGYPSEKFEKRLIKGDDLIELSRVECKIDHSEIEDIKESVNKVFVSDTVIDYIYEIASLTRNGLYRAGLSTRAVLILTKMAKSWAFIKGRDFVTPEDVQTVLPYIIKSRIEPVHSSSSHHKVAEEIIKSLQVD
jgi:MoxR-like ATPase